VFQADESVAASSTPPTHFLPERHGTSRTPPVPGIMIATRLRIIHGKNRRAGDGSTNLQPKFTRQIRKPRRKTEAQ
jgi:hypothetical protein